MRRSIRFLSFAALLSLSCGSALADHDTPSSMLGYWMQYQSRMHILQPTQKPRELTATANRELAADLAKLAERIVDDALAVVVIDGGELMVETYANGASRDTRMNTYSMTKSMTALAVGEALCAGKIASLDDKAVKYVPALEGTAYGAASIRHLLSYTSGAQDPGGNGHVGIHSMADFRAMTTHQTSLLDLVRKYGEQQFAAGSKFVYNGLDSETLSLVLRAATGKSLPHWFEETVWQKAGAEHSAGWYLDKEGNGIGEILFLATTRDLARIGLYVLDRLAGNTADACVNQFIKDAARPHINKGYWEPAPRFGLGLHVGSDGLTWIFGHGGQRMAINTVKRRVVATNGYKDWRDTSDKVKSLASY
jgi:CubicO group peptidase (beta-lactamase class C family)